jgi:hypothetical protein
LGPSQMYLRYPLSFRNGEDLMAQPKRGGIGPFLWRA